MKVFTRCKDALVSAFGVPLAAVTFKALLMTVSNLASERRPLHLEGIAVTAFSGERSSVRKLFGKRASKVNRLCLHAFPPTDKGG